MSSGRTEQDPAEGVKPPPLPAEPRPRLGNDVLGRAANGDRDAARLCQRPGERTAGKAGTPGRRDQEQEAPGVADARPGRGAEAVPVGVGVTTIIRELALDAGFPVAAYFGLRLIGVAGWPTGLAAALAAVSRVIWVGVRAHTLNPFAMLMVVVFGLDLALYFLTGDARVVLIKGSITAATIGIVFLVMVALGIRLR